MPMDISPPDPGRQSQAGHRLNSWKEIAVHLGKSVRTVQRWEQVYGLPVHRMGHEGGEIIWADVVELDEWVLSQSRHGTPPRDANHEDPLPASETQLVHNALDNPKTVAPDRNRGLGAGVGVAVIAVIAAAAFQYANAPLDAVDLTIQGHSIAGISADGRTAWTYAFPGPIDPAAVSKDSMNRPGSRVRRLDIDGDDRAETLVAFANGPRSSDSAFHVIGADGVPRFPPVRPADSVTFGATVYHAPWTPYRLFVTTTDSGDVRLHVVFIHLNEFPTLLLTLDRDGRIVSKYWSNGYIETVNTGVRNGKRVWLVGATHNDTRGASLALFDNEPHGAAPAAQEGYRCRDCSGGGPTAFLVLPRLCMSPAIAVSGQATATEAYMDASGALFVHVREGTVSTAGLPGSEVIYSFNGQLKPAAVLVTSGLLTEHRYLEKQGLLDHAWSPREETTLFPALMWDGARFVPMPRGKVTY